MVADMLNPVSPTQETCNFSVEACKSEFSLFSLTIRVRFPFVTCKLENSIGEVGCSINIFLDALPCKLLNKICEGSAPGVFSAKKKILNNY